MEQNNKDVAKSLEKYAEYNSKGVNMKGIKSFFAIFLVIISALFIFLFKWMSGI